MRCLLQRFNAIRQALANRREVVVVDITELRLHVAHHQKQVGERPARIALRGPSVVVVRPAAHEESGIRRRTAADQPSPGKRLRPAGAPVSFIRGRIEALPFENGSFDAVISNGVVNLSADKGRVFAEAARVLRPGGRLALADIVTERQIAPHTACQADLWAACIAGAAREDLYLGHVLAAGLELNALRGNPYRFTSDRARRASEKYGAQACSPL